MSNLFYTATANPITRSVSSSSLMRTEFAAIEGAFDKLPPHYGGATQGFTGGSWSQPSISNGSITGSQLQNVYGSVTAIHTNDTSTFTGPSNHSADGMSIYAVNTGNFRAGIGVGSSSTHYLLFDSYSNIIFGDGSNALATTATDQFLMIPTCAGNPTGTPAHTYASSVPLVYDSTNNKLFVYDGGWLETVALT